MSGRSARWRSQLEDRSSTCPTMTRGDCRTSMKSASWLSDHLPKDRRIGLIHGDLQFANVLFSLDSPRISGVVDWELATLGDPLLDLGWVLGSWWEEGDPDGKRPLVAPWENFMPRAELARLYGEITARSMDELPWYFALACFKLACLLEGTYARSRARPGAGTHRRADSRLCNLADAQGDADHLELTRAASLRPAFDTDRGCGRPPSAGN